MRRTWCGVLMAAALVVGAANEADASEAYGASAQLLGWSEDGRTWAVLSSAETESIEVYTDGKRVLTLCTPDEFEGDCEDSKTVKAIDVMDNERFTGMQRVNIEKQKHLKRFKLKRLQSSMRKTFKQDYVLKGIGKSTEHSGKRCKAGWSLQRKADGKALHEHREKEGCVRAKGGFLHTNGKVALVKQLHWGDDYDEDVGLSSYELERYILVEVAAATAK